MKIQKGFTLLELMIVLAVLGIIVAIALPAYDRYRERAYRTEVRAALELVSQKLQEGYAQTRQYGCLKVKNDGTCDQNADTKYKEWVDSLASSRVAYAGNASGSTLWEINVQLVDDAGGVCTDTQQCKGYEITATATTVGNKRLSTCKWYGINERNIKVANSTTAEAWGTPRSPVSRECWNR